MIFSSQKTEARLLYTVRPFRESDKDNLRKICMETSDDVFHKNEKLLKAVPLIYNDYFTECEPENCFVAADGEDKAVGYIICSSDKKKFLKEMRRVYIPRASHQHPFMFFCSVAYMAGVLRHGKGEYAHLHIDITESYQHKGAGTALLDALRAHLHEIGVDTLYVNTITRDDPAYPFYRKYGFEEYGNIGFGFITLGIKTK